MTQAPRLLPLVAFAALCLAGLKLAGLMLGGGFVLTGVAPATAQSTPLIPQPEPEAKEGEQSQPAEPQNAAEPHNAADPHPESVEEKSVAAVSNSEVVSGPKLAPSRTEMDVLESLAQRRKSLDARERELQLRENLLRAAESKVESRINELKGIEARIEADLKKQDEERKAQQDKLVQMYALMKPKDAATILNHMNPDVLTSLFTQMQPRVMSAILSEMDPLVAQRVTVELASKSAAAPAPTEDLPKIQGKGPS